MTGLFILFLSIIFGLQKDVYAANSLEQYCRNGVYYLNGVACGRAPNCNGATYDQTAAMGWESVAQCWNSRCARGMCQGEVPLCCYELEQTGDPMMCNWPERGFCHQTQCAKVNAQKARACNGGSGDCNCGDALIGWCSNKPINEGGCRIPREQIPYISLQNRLSGNVSTPTPAPAVNITPTITPSGISQPTAVPTATITPSPTITSTPTPSPYPTTGIALLPRSKSNNLITSPPYCPSSYGCILKTKGDANCSGNVDDADFNEWKTKYDTYVPGSFQNPNPNFSCVEGNTVTYYVDLFDFEVWRRNK